MIDLQITCAPCLAVFASTYVIYKTSCGCVRLVAVAGGLHCRLFNKPKRDPKSAVLVKHLAFTVSAWARVWPLKAFGTLEKAN